LKLKHTGKQTVLKSLPSVDEILKGPEGITWLLKYPRKIVLQAVREALSLSRQALLDGSITVFSSDNLFSEITSKLQKLSAYSLLPVINATGIVIHTNLGRAVLSERMLQNIIAAGAGYSNLEYDLEHGKRGKRHIHTKRLLKQITGAEDTLIVNNNAAAVLLCLNTLAQGKEVIVSRSELVEIGGSFRVPDIMSASNAILREVGTTNKTHLFDYKRAINKNTGLILKVHQSNYLITGFTDDVDIDELIILGKKNRIPVMYDLGSGCLLNLKSHGIYTEPAVREIVRTGIDVVTFSGDKLLGGPQGGLIVGKKKYIQKIQKNPLARAMRIDKLTIAAFEATLMEYMDEKRAQQTIPVLNMLLQNPEEIRTRARRIASKLQKQIKNVHIEILKDTSKAGGGSLPETDFPTYVVSIKPDTMSVNELEKRLRNGSPPVIARIKGRLLLLDARTILKRDIPGLISTVTLSLAKD
jgi:L-seryl-tRNA(Ser) seleniumtransferase